MIVTLHICIQAQQWIIARLKKFPSGQLRQADIPAGQATFHTHLKEKKSYQATHCLEKEKLESC